MNPALRIFFILIPLVFILPIAVGAHAYLESSIPIQESQLEESPQEIKVRFTEPINTNLSNVTLKNEAGVVKQGKIYSENNRELILRIPPLEDGIYYVNWQVLSLDSHITDGSYRFSVGVELPALIPLDTISLDEHLSTHNHRHMSLKKNTTQSVLDVSTHLRIIEIIFLIMTAGLFFFQRVLLYDKTLPWLRVRTVYFISAILFLLSGLGQMSVRSAQLNQQAWLEILPTMLTATNIGIVSWLQPLLFLLLFMSTYFKKQGQPLFLSVIFLILFYTFAWTGHAFQYNVIIIHVFHMITASIWIGGILGFLIFSFKEESNLNNLKFIHEKLLRFSKYALVSIGLVILSGIVLTTTYLNNWTDFFTSYYGLTLLLKIIVFSPILIIPTFHHFVWLPQLKKGKVSSVNKLYWGLRAELIIAISVIILAGMLSTLSPPVE